MTTTRLGFIRFVALACAIAWGAVAQAASLTIAQLQALKATIDADPALTAFPNSPDGNFEVAAALNVTASPDYWAWRTSVPAQEIYETTTAEGTTWSWTAFIGRTQGERDGWRTMTASGGINPSLANVRAGAADIFSGTAASAVSQRAHFLTMSRRKATRAEKVLATATAGGSGTRGSTANPDTLTFEGNLMYQDVQQARDLP